MVTTNKKIPAIGFSIGFSLLKPYHVALIQVDDGRKSTDPFPGVESTKPNRLDMRVFP